MHKTFLIQSSVLGDIEFALGAPLRCWIQDFVALEDNASFREWNPDVQMALETGLDASTRRTLAAHNVHPYDEDLEGVYGIVFGLDETPSFED